ncbi:SH3 domain-containing protein [Mesorhizobium sp. CAU 1732]|uniref:SH3 domain-containing protein n=1 Tax=Mesorhizobium sp. CAU 1732 TaxID=3140358 RepID=UPI003261097E
MKSPFKIGRGQEPFLSPLQAKSKLPRMSRQSFDKLPAAAAPIAVTVIGGLALVVMLGWFLSREAGISTVQDSASIAEASPPAEIAAADENEPVASAEMTPEISTAIEPDTAAAPETVNAAAPVPADTLLLNNSPLAGAPALDTAPPAPDAAATASIPPALPGITSFAPNVPVAESDDEIAALEAIQREEVDDDVGPPTDEPTAAIPAPAGPMSAATTTRWVNMRTGPADDAEIMVVVPALAEIQAETGCNWCSVSYEGQQGYIYKTFISYAEDSAAAE